MRADEWTSGNHKVEYAEKDPLARAKESDGMEGARLIIDDVFLVYSDYRPGYALTDYCGNSDTVVIPDIVTRIENGAFENNKSIRSVTIPESVRAIDADTAKRLCMDPNPIDYDVFRGCVNLREAKLPNSINIITGGIFMDCKSLKSITIPDTVTEIGECAFGGAGLNDVTIPDSVVSLGEAVFQECGQLKNIRLPRFITKIPEKAFYACGLEQIEIPCGVLKIGGEAFMYSHKIKKAILPDGLGEIGAYAFNCCYELEDIIIPDSVTIIGDGAFDLCDKLPEYVKERIRGINPKAIMFTI